MTIRKFAQSLLFISAFAFLLTGCHSVHKAPAISGTAIYLLNVPLPADAVVEFKWVETTPSGEVTNVIDTLQLRNIRRAPIPFEIPYNPSGIKRSKYYAITCEIRSGDKALFRSIRPFQVLTHGSSDNVEIILEKVL